VQQKCVELQQFATAFTATTAATASAAGEVVLVVVIVGVVAVVVAEAESFVCECASTSVRMCVSCSVCMRVFVEMFVFMGVNVY